MRKHMLIYHVGVPLAVFAVALLVGVSLSTAFRGAIVVGCVSMVVMMAAGSHRRGRWHTTPSAAQTASGSDPTTASATRR